MTIRNLVLILSLFYAISGMAQKELDSIISASTALLFEQPDQAIEIANDILKTSTKTETQIKALTFMSSAYLSKRENRKSLSFAMQALELIKKTENTLTQIEALNTIGMQHQQLRMYDKAKDYLDEALVLANSIEISENRSYLLAYNYTIRGFIYREQMNCEIAQSYFDRAISNFKASEKSLAHRANISTVYYNKGNCFLQTSQIDSAQINFQNSISYAKSSNASSLLSFAKKGLSEVYTADGQYKVAIKHLLEADSIATNVGDLVLNRGIYQNLADNFLAIGDKTQYQFYDALYQKTNRDLLIQERSLINESLQNLLTTIKAKSKEKMKKLDFLMLVIFSAASILFLLLTWMTLKSRKSFLKIKGEINSYSTQ